MGISERQLIQECFDGDRRRSCAYCPGHYSKSGSCCFGNKYESHDKTCQDCIHTEACESATLQFLSAQSYEEDDYYYGEAPSRRITIPSRPRATTTTTKSNKRLPVYGQTVTQRMSERLIEPKNTKPVKRDPDVIEPMRFHERGFFEQMGLHALWGAMEGAFEMLLGFLRNRRPE